MKRTAAITAYLTTIVAANWATARYGLVPVGFGLLAPAGVYAAGAAFVARDTVQDVAGRWATVATIAAGAALSAVVSTPQLAIASGTAFLVAELLDMAIYTPLRRHGYIRAALTSNIVGTAVDTVLFLTLAGFPLTAATFTGQMVGKFWITAIAVAAVVAWRTRRHVQAAHS